LPALVIAEATYFVGRRLGSAAEAAFLRGLAPLDVEGPLPEDFDRIAELVEQYADFPLGGTDASAIALAERIGAGVIVTLDRRHFAAVKPQHRDAFELLP
jgi:predicted nucleic acid-binding protein